MGRHFAHDVGGYLILKQEILFNSYNPYDGPNDNPELELPLTAGEYIYVYGDMDDDGFYEGNFEQFQLLCHTCSRVLLYSVSCYFSILNWS